MTPRFRGGCSVSVPAVGSSSTESGVTGPTCFPQRPPVFVWRSGVVVGRPLGLVCRIGVSGESLLYGGSGDRV